MKVKNFQKLTSDSDSSTPKTLAHIRGVVIYLSGIDIRKSQKKQFFRSVRANERTYERTNLTQCMTILSVEVTKNSTLQRPPIPST